MNMNLILLCDFACFLCYEIQKGDKLKDNLTKSHSPDLVGVHIFPFICHSSVYNIC